MAAQRLCASIGCMSVHYESVPLGTLYPEAFGIAAPLEALERHIWPRKPAVFIRLRRLLSLLCLNLICLQTPVCLLRQRALLSKACASCK